MGTGQNSSNPCSTEATSGLSDQGRLQALFHQHYWAHRQWSGWMNGRPERWAIGSGRNWRNSAGSCEGAAHFGIARTGNCDDGGAGLGSGHGFVFNLLGVMGR